MYHLINIKHRPDSIYHQHVTSGQCEILTKNYKLALLLKFVQGFRFASGGTYKDKLATLYLD